MVHEWLFAVANQVGAAIRARMPYMWSQEGTRNMTDDPPTERVLSPQAKRALAEAQARRKAEEAAAQAQAEQGGPTGPEPTRYGDWERKGIAYDF